jgi:ATP-dependent transcriptional regulator
MTSSLQSVSGRPVTGMAREIVCYVEQFFKKQEEEHKLNIDITTVTSEAKRILERLHVLYLKKVKNLLRKGNYASVRLRERKVQKNKSLHRFYQTENPQILCCQKSVLLSDN